MKRDRTPASPSERRAVGVDETNRYVTLVNTFSVDPENQRRLVELLDEATEGTMRTLPGFVSASIHESLDGKRVVNYAQWATEKDFRNMLSNAEARRHMERANELARADPNLYRVSSVHRRD